MSNMKLKPGSGVQTNWVVITGLTCSRKTSLIKNFSDLGYETIPEIARDYISKTMEKGLPPTKLKSDRKDYFNHLLNLQIDKELDLLTDFNDIIFFREGDPRHICIRNS